MAGEAIKAEREHRINFFESLKAQSTPHQLMRDIWRVITTFLSYFDLCRLRFVSRYFASLHSWVEWQNCKLAYLKSLNYEPDVIARVFSQPLLLRHFERVGKRKSYHWKNELKPIPQDVPKHKAYIHQATIKILGNICILQKILTYLRDHVTQRTVIFLFDIISLRAIFLYGHCLISETSFLKPEVNLRFLLN
jgi:hypothetical protein